MPNLGVTVYLWSLDAQNRFLSLCLAPLIKELRQEGFVGRFWFERMDIRGPHVFAPIKVADGAVAEVCERLSARIGAHLSEDPCSLSMTPAEIQVRHDYCRGKLQSAADRLPGFARNNTFNILPHDERDYPFHLSSDLADEEELWLLLTELTLWSVSQLSDSSGAQKTNAIRWFTVFGEAVRTNLNEPERYWYHHATTLILNLVDRLVTEEDRVLLQLPRAFSERDADIFSNAWSELEEDWYPSPRIRRIVRIVLNASELTERKRFCLLREIIHVGLKQLCLKVALHCPLVLFAWSRSLARETAVLAPAL